MVVVRFLLAAVVSASASPAVRESPPPPVAVTTANVFPPRMAHGYRTLHVPLGRLALDAGAGR